LVGGARGAQKDGRPGQAAGPATATGTTTRLLAVALCGRHAPAGHLHGGQHGWAVNNSGPTPPRLLRRGAMALFAPPQGNMAAEYTYMELLYEPKRATKPQMEGHQCPHLF